MDKKNNVHNLENCKYVHIKLLNKTGTRDSIILFETLNFDK